MQPHPTSTLQAVHPSSASEFPSSQPSLPTTIPSSQISSQVLSVVVVQPEHVQPTST